MKSFNSMDDAYRELCYNLKYNSEEVNGTHELRNYCFTLNDVTKNIINIRNISESYLCGEMLWYMCARNDVAFIDKFSHFWKKISDDGLTSYSAYGNILFRKHGFDQVQTIIDLLNTDRNSRRGVLNLNVPNPNVINTKDEVCTIAVTYYIRDNKLYCTNVMRSNDFWFGLSYDELFFTELQKYIAKRVNADLGTYTHFAISMHCYDRDYSHLSEVIAAEPTKFLSFDIEKLIEHKEELEKFVENTDEDVRSKTVTMFKELNILKEEQ